MRIILIFAILLVVNGSVLTKFEETARFLSKNTIRLIVDYYYDGSGLNVITFGKTGVGKSSLLNNLFSARIFEEGEYEATTKKIQKYSQKIQGVTVNFYDTPGLFDTEKNNKKYWISIAETILKMDLIIVCMDVRDKRFRDEDMMIFRLLTESFGVQILNKVLVAFTFSNEVRENNFITKSHILNQKIKVATIAVGFRKHIIFNGYDWYANAWFRILNIVDIKNQATIAKLTFEKVYDKVRKSDSLMKKVKQEIKQKAPREVREMIAHRCICGDTLLTKQNGDVIFAINVKKNDMLVGGRVYYVAKYSGHFEVIEFNQILFAHTHMIYIDNQLMPAYKLSNKTNSCNDLIFILTTENYYMSGNVKISNFTGSGLWWHYVKVVIFAILRLF